MKTKGQREILVLIHYLFLPFWMFAIPTCPMKKQMLNLVNLKFSNSVLDDHNVFLSSATYDYAHLGLLPAVKLLFL